VDEFAPNLVLGKGRRRKKAPVTICRQSVKGGGRLSPLLIDEASGR